MQVESRVLRAAGEPGVHGFPWPRLPRFNQQKRFVSWSARPRERCRAKTELGFSPQLRTRLSLPASDQVPAAEQPSPSPQPLTLLDAQSLQTLLEAE